MIRYFRLFWALGLLAYLGCGSSPERPRCTGDSDCDEQEVCYIDGKCLARDVARQLGGVGNECGPEALCEKGRCFAGYCVTSDIPKTDGGKESEASKE